MSSNTGADSAITAYETPQTAQDARELLNEHGTDAKIAGGGQSLSLLLRQGLLDPEVIVDISDVKTYRGVTIDETTVKIGAATTYNELKRHAVSREEHILGDAIDVIADNQIRNLGTIGGAISHADPALDIVPPLLCLDAAVEIGRVDGARTVPLDEFAIGYMTTDLNENELVEAVSFERVSDRSGSAYEKLANVKGGWAIVGVGAHVTLDEAATRIEEARVALTAVADTGVRAPSVEEALNGSSLDNVVLADAVSNVTDDIDPLDDLSGSVTYKEHLAQSLTTRALTSAITRAGGDLE